MTFVIGFQIYPPKNPLIVLLFSLLDFLFKPLIPLLPLGPSLVLWRMVDIRP